MKRKQDYLLMALTLLMTLGLIGAISVSVNYATKAATREYEYEILRREYQERIEKEKAALKNEIDSLNHKMESESYLNSRRFDILSAELNQLQKQQKEMKHINSQP